MEPQEIEDIQALINIFFPFAEELIVKFGEFFPYAGATTTEGEFVSVGFHEDNKHLSSEQVIVSLKNSLKLASTKYLVCAIFYNARTRDPETGESRDTIAIILEHKNGTQAYEFFYPYRLEGEDNFIVEDSFGKSMEREIYG